MHHEISQLKKNDVLANGFKIRTVPLQYVNCDLISRTFITVYKNHIHQSACMDFTIISNSHGAGLMNSIRLSRRFPLNDCK